MSDADVPSTVAVRIPAVGTISVTLWNVINVQAVPITMPMEDSPRHKTIERLSEKSMKRDTRSYTFK